VGSYGSERVPPLRDDVRDDPTGLALGEYRDTVMVSGSTGGIIRVGVVLRILP